MVFQTLRFLWNPQFSAVEQGSHGENPMAANRSALKDFLISIASMTGDLSNITAPPFVLDPKSVVEIPAFWAENPRMFVSPALSEDPAERALLVLKSFLGGIKSQCYMGHSEEEGVKKPLNAFLGELFLGHWEDDELGDTYMVSEQVSHHPPITACRVWNPKLGVIAEGYNKQKITFSMSSLSVHINSTGFALKTIERYDEHYLLPLPDFKVKGVLSGAPYPETSGEWYIPSTNGYMSKIDFSGGRSLLGHGKKHEFSAVLYQEDDGPSHPIYSIHGCWNTEFVVRDERAGHDMETFRVKEAAENLPELKLPPVEEMDPWESRRAWHDTEEAIRRLDYKGVTAAKGHLEQGQRNMRKDEEKAGKTWEPLFFKSGDHHVIVEKLMAKVPAEDFTKIRDSSKGIWLFDHQAWDQRQRPFHPGLEPDNLNDGQDRVYRNGVRASFQSSRSATSPSSVNRRRSRSDSPMSAAATISPPVEARADDKVGAKDDGRPAEVDGTLVDVGQQPQKKHLAGISADEPQPQKAQLRQKEEDLGSGVAGLSVQEKIAVEEMLRDKYASGLSRR